MTYAHVGQVPRPVGCLGGKRVGTVGWQEFGLVGIALIVVLEAVKIIGSLVRVKLNGKVEDPAVKDLGDKLSRALLNGFERISKPWEQYIIEDREAHRTIDRDLTEIKTLLRGK